MLPLTGCMAHQGVDRAESQAPQRQSSGARQAAPTGARARAGTQVSPRAHIGLDVDAGGGDVRAARAHADHAGVVVDADRQALRARLAHTCDCQCPPVSERGGAAVCAPGAPAPQPAGTAELPHKRAQCRRARPNGVLEADDHPSCCPVRDCAACFLERPLQPPPGSPGAHQGGGHVGGAVVEQLGRVDCELGLGLARNHAVHALNLLPNLREQLRNGLVRGLRAQRRRALSAGQGIADAQEGSRVLEARAARTAQSPCASSMAGASSDA